MMPWRDKRCGNCKHTCVPEDSIYLHCNFDKENIFEVHPNQICDDYKYEYADEETE